MMQLVQGRQLSSENQKSLPPYRDQDAPNIPIVKNHECSVTPYQMLRFRRNFICGY